MKRLLVGFMAVILAMTPMYIGARDYYVAPNGSDTNPGTKVQPFATIQHGVNQLVAGDTLYLRAGSYHEEVVINNLNGTAANPITICNYLDEKVTLDGTVPITGSWTRHRGNIYKITVPQDVWQLFVDGTMQIVARWPNVTVGHPCDPFQHKADGYTPKDGTWWSRFTTWARANPAGTQDGTVQNNTAYHDLGATGKSFAGGSAILQFGSFLTYERKINSHSVGSQVFTHDPLNSRKYNGEGWFFLEHLNALDLPGEWYFTPANKTVYLWADDGQNPTGRNIRGKTQMFAIDLTDCAYLDFRGLNFFATTVNSTNGDHITFENCVFSYPSWFQRLLGKYWMGNGQLHDNQTTLSGAAYIVTNCVFEYTEGHALEIKGDGNHTIENNYFHHVDFTGLGSKAIKLSCKNVNAFKHNTLCVSGPSEGITCCPGPKEYNHVYWFGYLQDDGGGFQGSAPKIKDRAYNWVHHTLKYSLRSDGNPAGTGALDHHNVVWTARTIRMKGDWHEIYNNTGYNQTDKANLIKEGKTQGNINIATDKHPTPNKHTITRNNAADAIVPSSWICGDPIPGTHDHNWNGCWNGKSIKDQLRDPDNWDFRPRAGSDLVDAGKVIPGITDGYIGKAPDIGAYEYGDPNYWIPGRKWPKASTPIPPDGSITVKPDADLMWLGGLRAISHDVYFGQSKDAVANANHASDEYKVQQTNNIFEPGLLKPNITYYWRIDALDAAGNVKTYGDVWSFRTP